MTDVSGDDAAIGEIVRSVRTVAVVGMKDADGGGAAYRIPQMMQEVGVRVIPVNPKIASSLGERARATLAEVGEPVDVVQIFRRSENVPAHADEILALPPHLRPKVVWMQSGIAHRGAAAKLAAAGMKVVMDRCMSVEMARHGVSR